MSGITLREMGDLLISLNTQDIFISEYTISLPHIRYLRIHHILGLLYTAEKSLDCQNQQTHKLFESIVTLQITESKDD